MAAIHSAARVSTGTSSTRSAPAEGRSVARRAASLVVAVACASAGLFMASAYPIAPVAAMVVFVAWVAFAFARFPIALPAMLALLPVTGFATLTGWLTFEELDLLILASCAGGYAALALASSRKDGDGGDRPALSIFSITLIGLFLASTVISLERGIDAAGGFHFDWFQGYDDPLNAVRIFKSFAWAMLVAPLLMRELRAPGGIDRLCMGMTAALGLCTLAVLQERLAFTGLLDFSDDYRVTAPFWEMHVGGAALDGFLALTLPFAVREAVRNANRARLIGGWAVLALAAYACLVTFSRGVYAAAPLSLLLLLVLVYRQRLRLDRGELWALLGKGSVFAVVVAASGFVVFRSGGYRAVLATFLVLVLTIPVELALRRTSIGNWATAAFAAVMLGAFGYLVGGVLPKGPYLVFGAAFVATVAATLQAEHNTAARLVKPLATGVVAGWLWLALCGVLVAGNWGGGGALRDSAAVLGALVVAAFAASRLPRPVWPEKRHEQLAAIGFAAAVMGSVAVFTAGAYMGGRFSSSRGDLDLRIAHWTEGIGRLHGVGEWSFGKGLGRFPATSHFDAPTTIMPGSYHIASRDGERFLALTGPRLPYVGWDELFRFSQRVTVRPLTNYLVILRARSASASGVHVELCEKMLLYHGTCVATDPQVPAGTDGWREFRFPLQTGTIGSSRGWFARPVYFAIATGNSNAVLEIRSLRVIGPDGVDVIGNGDFAQRTAYWFSSSDKWHLPWHIKNIVLDVLFDQGLVGLALFALLVGGAFLRSAVGRAFRHPDAPYVAAAIAGYLVVGAFDSLLDVPRVAFAFYLVVLVGLMLRNPRATAAAKAEAAPPRPAPPPPVEDEAAARARRRQQAFGDRVPKSR